MNLTVRHEMNDVVVVTIDCDNLDASNVKQFRSDMGAVIQKNPRVVVDMSSLKFVDSSGLGALISCLRETNSLKGDLRLCALTRSVSALFELMRIHRVFSIHSSPDMAVNSFA